MRRVPLSRRRRRARAAVADASLAVTSRKSETDTERKLRRRGRRFLSLGQANTRCFRDLDRPLQDGSCWYFWTRQRRAVLNAFLSQNVPVLDGIARAKYVDITRGGIWRAKRACEANQSPS